jgi:hypothetical protein
MRRRYFEFLYAEICVAIGRRISRYALWILVSERIGDPESLSRHEIERFLDEELGALLAHEHGFLTPRARTRLRRRLLAFDPHHPTPEEWLMGLSGGLA